MNPIQQFALALRLHANALSRRKGEIARIPGTAGPIVVRSLNASRVRFLNANNDVIVFARMARRHAVRLNAALAAQRFRYATVSTVQS